ncbi:MAG: putative Insecticidal toxin complex protein TccB2 [Geoglossum umbratile]|nr:MAG: putative Insecticidal toxin complex protein TccB2 [Geoglossum umbratile]
MRLDEAVGLGNYFALIFHWNDIFTSPELPPGASGVIRTPRILPLELVAELEDFKVEFLSFAIDDPDLPVAEIVGEVFKVAAPTHKFDNLKPFQEDLDLIVRLCIIFHVGTVIEVCALMAARISGAAVPSVGDNELRKVLSGDFSRDAVFHYIRNSLYATDPLVASTALLLIDGLSLPGWLPEPQASHERRFLANFAMTNAQRNPRVESLPALIAEQVTAFPELSAHTDWKSATRFLLTLERIAVIASESQLLIPTLKAGYVSGHSIASVSEAKFSLDVRPFATGVDKALQQLHKNAVAVTLRTESVLISMAEYIRGSGLRLLDRGQNPQTRSQAVRDHMNALGFDHSVDSLIGKIDNFECADCMSVSSASAYLVEILKFLPDDARSQLLMRRPDIARIELTCENIGVELPYIDLANEVMESFISNLSIAGRALPDHVDIDSHDTPTDADTADLLAEPEYLNTSVYSGILQKTFFPLSLPYSFGLRKIRLLLRCLKTSRYELLTTFRDESKVRAVKGSANVPAKTLMGLQSDVIENASNAEYLGLSYGDFVAITNESYWPISFFDTTDQRLSIAAYQEKIGLVPVHQLWGYATPEEMGKGLSSLKDGFLPRSGLTYQDYVSLTQTQLFRSFLKADIQFSPKLDETTSDLIQSFLRLKARLALSIDELDQAISVLHGVNADHKCLTPAFLGQLVAVQKIRAMTNQDILTLLSFWGPISVTGEGTLYKKVFLRRSIKRLDSVFGTLVAADGRFSGGNVDLKPHLSVVLAALGCSPGAFTTISQSDVAALQSPDQWSKVSIENLSILYRCVALAAAAQIRQSSVVTFAAVFPKIFLGTPEQPKDALTRPLEGDVEQIAEEGPRRTLDALAKWAKFSAAGLTIEQVLFIKNGVPPQPSESLDMATLKASHALVVGLLEVHSKFPDSNQAGYSVDQLKSLASPYFKVDVLQGIFELLLGTSSHISDTFQTISPKGSALNPDLPPRLKYIEINGATSSGRFQLQGLMAEADWALSQEAIVKQSVGQAAAAALTNLKAVAFQDAQQVAQIINDRLCPIAQFHGSLPASNPGVILTSGDAADAATVPASQNPKLAALHDLLVSFLRQSMQEQTIISSLSKGVPTLDTQMLQYLLKGIVTVSVSNAQIAITGFSQLASLPKSSIAVSSENTKWSGYLNVPTLAGYVLVSLRNEKEKPERVSINGNPIDWNRKQNAWATEPVFLSPDRFYKISLPDLGVKWKSDSFAASEIPASVLVSEHTFLVVRNIILILQRLSLVINAFSLNQDDISFINSYSVRFSQINFNSLTVDNLSVLASYANMRDDCRKTHNSSQTNAILDTLNYVFNSAATASSVSEISKQVCQFTGWNAKILEQILPVVCKTSDPVNIAASMSDWATFERLFRVTNFTVKIGVNVKDVMNLFGWAEPTGYLPDTETDTGIVEQDMKNAASIAQFARNRINDKDWDKAIHPINDQLRQGRRDAMIAYLLQQKFLKDSGVTDADGLFEFFLIDTQMGTALTTSRIKQAISTVQVFVQRVLLGEEKGGPFTIDKVRWEWMQKYRVWEAARKGFLWPENWLDSSLLDVKTPLFAALESDLRQTNVTLDTAQNVLTNYLYGLSDIADLQYISYFRDSTEEVEPYTLHLFARTRHSPYIYYHRTRETSSGYSPWEQIQTDIPSFDSDRSDQTHTSTPTSISGTYLVPYVWNRRVLVFIPQFRKTDLPGADNTKQAPKTWNIQLSWSELRNGKWSSRRAISAILTDMKRPELAIDLVAPNLDSYAFIVSSSSNNSIQIDVLRQFWHPKDKPKNQGDNPPSNPGAVYHIGHFILDTTQFDGQVVLESTDGKLTKDDVDISMTTQFQTQPDGTLVSPQRHMKIPPDTQFESSTIPLVINRTMDPEGGFKTDSRLQFFRDSDFNQEILYHTYAHRLVEVATQSPDNALSAILEVSNKATSEALGGDASDGISGPYNALSKAYSMYNWELGLFVPMLIVDNLLNTQQFNDALKVIRTILDPRGAAEGTSIWKWKPFIALSDKNAVTDSIFDPVTLGNWKDTPFDPHAVARERPFGFMKWVAVKYIKILIAYGDFYFRQDTLETLPEAIQCYVEASHLYGPRPEQYTQPAKPDVQTFATLAAAAAASVPSGREGSWQADFESAFPWDPPPNPDFPTEANWLTGDTVTSHHFCIPQNPLPVTLRDILDDRLFKIRNSMDINGHVRSLPLFEPPIDPGLLVQAAAAGSLNLSGTLSDLDAPLVNIRFSKLMERVMGICSDLRAFGSALLSAIQSKDTETFAALQAKQLTLVQQLSMGMKELALEQANKTMIALQDSRKAPVNRLRQLLRLTGGDLKLIPGESEDFEELEPDIDPPVDGPYGMTGQEAAALALTASGIATKTAACPLTLAAGAGGTIPDEYSLLVIADVAVAGLKVGGKQVISGFESAAKVSATAGELMMSTAEMVQRTAEYKARLAGRKLEANEAGFAIKAIDRQIEIQKILTNLAQTDLDNQQKAIDQATEVEDFLKSKYTNVDLYNWMVGILQGVYYQTYTIAYDLAKRAEKAYRFECGVDSEIIGFGFWDVSHNGLLAGEKLYIGLQKLQQAYDDTRAYDFEIKKVASLRQIDPFGLHNLRTNGSCTFWLPEVMFDMDFPGHYKRRIKSLTLTFTGVTGSSVSATLTLIEHKYRLSTNVQPTYTETSGGLDDRFRTDNIPIRSVAISDVSGDSGSFNLDFTANSFAPFEGAGAISHWSLDLSPFSDLDPATITDLVMNLRYTASNGVGDFQDTVKQWIQKFLHSTQLNGAALTATFDLSIDFSATAWQTFAIGSNIEQRKLRLDGLIQKFPFWTRSSISGVGGTIKPQQIYIITDSFPINKMTLSITEKSTPSLFSFKQGPASQGANELTIWSVDPTHDPVLSSVTLKSRPVDGKVFEIEVDRHLAPVSAMWMIVVYNMGNEILGKAVGVDV